VFGVWLLNGCPSVENWMEKQVEKVAEWINTAKRVVVFTGAGLSTESGIPDFRSPGGVWDRYNPEDFYFQNFLASEASREKYWQMATEMYEPMKKAPPNAAHLAIGELERLGKLDCVITQNIDGLHFKAPYCDDCRGPLKPATISFGQSMPEAETQEAYHRSSLCDLFIVIGSSLVVQPAASMPLVAKRNGAKLVIINRDPTPYDHSADIVIHGLAGPTMASILEKVHPARSG
jgi:NAD-dependent deacetylase